MFGDTKKILVGQIEAGRTYMIELANDKGRQHSEVIKVSQDLDKLISKYYR